MSIFRNIGNISDDKMIAYINNYTSTNESQLLYRYLYLVSKHIASKNKYFTKATELDKFSIYVASHLYNKRLNQSFTNFYDEFNLVNLQYRVLSNNKFNLSEVNLSNKTYNLRESLLQLIEQLSDVYFDITQTDVFIKKFLDTIPKKKHSAEFDNITTSVLLSLIKTIKTEGENIFNTNYELVVTPYLYHLDSSYRNYVQYLSNMLCIYIRDNYNKIIFSNQLSINLLNLIEALYEQ